MSRISQIPRVKVTKAVITAAGKLQRTLPLQTLVDRDGVSRSALAILAGEITAAGIEEIAVIICPGDESAYAEAAGPHASHMRFIEQAEPLGYAHAVQCAAGFTGVCIYRSRFETQNETHQSAKSRGIRRPVA